MSKDDSKDHPNQNKVQVSVYTTSGAYPDTGHEDHNRNQPIKQILKKADDAFGISDSSGWVAVVEGRTIDPSKTYEEEDLSGLVEINWGPEEGGGGCIA